MFALSTDTGRFNCTKPNCQNMPRKTNDPVGIRNFVKAPDGKVIISLDFSQIELRVGAFYCRDENMLQTYRDNGDIHAQTTAVIFSMNDPYRDIPSGTKGTVKEVDDTGTIHVHWDNGCSLGVVYGEDSCRKLNTVKVICYNDEEEWDSREDALEFYMKAMAGSEGSEQERYAKIVAELAMGKAVCTDGEE